MATDAIVNTSNPYPLVGTDTDSAVYEAAGKEESFHNRLQDFIAARNL